MPQKDYNDIAQTGLTFPDVNLVVYPRAALGESAKVVNLKLTHLPMLPAEEVKKGLAKSLAVFGDIMDVGISTDTATGFFMGTGYAVLNIQQDPSAFDVQKFQTLSHQISWCESPDDFFHATWNNMPTWCRYCHKEGHTKIECPQSRARIICYSCHQNGHRSFECPRKNLSISAYKKRDRKSYQTSLPAPSLSLDQTATTPDTDDDPDDFEYQEEGGEDMSITSEGTSDDRIDNEELSQLKQDLGMPALPTHNIDNRSEPNDLTDTSGYTTNKELTTIVWTTDDLNSEQRGLSPEGRMRSSIKSQR
ncbi:hypothetical protein G6F61_012609 [Rhizopus arrhizus]|nr:hypothetical protein G6F61_012609 [Rhizopus arrhizus]